MLLVICMSKVSGQWLSLWTGWIVLVQHECLKCGCVYTLYCCWKDLERAQKRSKELKSALKYDCMTKSHRGIKSWFTFRIPLPTHWCSFEFSSSSLIHNIVTGLSNVYVFLFFYLCNIKSLHKQLVRRHFCLFQMQSDVISMSNASFHQSRFKLPDKTNTVRYFWSSKQKLTQLSPKSHSILTYSLNSKVFPTKMRCRHVHRTTEVPNNDNQ